MDHVTVQMVEMNTTALVFVTGKILLAVHCVSTQPVHVETSTSSVEVKGGVYLSQGYVTVLLTAKILLMKKIPYVHIKHVTHFPHIFLVQTVNLSLICYVFLT